MSESVVENCSTQQEVLTQEELAIRARETKKRYNQTYYAKNADKLREKNRERLMQRYYTQRSAMFEPLAAKLGVLDEWMSIPLNQRTKRRFEELIESIEEIVEN